MKLGIKVGLLNLKENLNNIREIPDLEAAEVWYDAGKPEAYKELFKALKDRKIDVGLHYWGRNKDGISANLAYPDKKIINFSIASICHTIDTARENGFQYVNVHPGYEALVGIDFLKEKFHLLSKPKSFKEIISIFLENAHFLDDYGALRQITITFETVPLKVAAIGWYGKSTRDKPEEVYQLGINYLKAAAEAGLYIANDFGHTAADIITQDPKNVWNFLKKSTIFLSSQTRLIHLGFVIPPYNGTDIHDTFENPVFSTTLAVPNRNQMIELLRIFKKKKNLWIIPEPKGNHRKNYYLAKEMLSQI